MSVSFGGKYFETIEELKDRLREQLFGCHSADDLCLIHKILNDDEMEYHPAEFDCGDSAVNGIFSSSADGITEDK